MNNIKERLIDVRDLLQGHILALIIILVIVIGIPITFYLAKQQQDLRSKATDAGRLVFIPPTPTGSVNINSAFDLEFGINLNPAARITGADVTISYTNNLRLDTFLKDTTVLPEEILNNSNPAVNPITLHYVAVSKSGDLASRTYVPLGKLTFTAISAGSATITVITNQIVAKDQPGTLAIGNATTTYTVAARVNGAWSVWSGGTCTVTCDGGTLTGETRTCYAPAGGGTECTRLDNTQTNSENWTDTRSGVTACNTQACPVNGAWSAWSACSATACGTSGTQTRTCDNPSPSNGGSACTGSATQACAASACAVNGAWSAWSACSATACGTSGTQTRTCDNPSPSNGGSACTGSATQACAASACAVNGAWSAWSGGTCTVTCGGGTLTGETRTCSAPTGGGTECTMLDNRTLTTPTNRTETRSAVTACNTQACPCINGDTIGGNSCVSIDDYNTWYSEFTGAVTTKTADFYSVCNSSNQKGDGVIDINDYNIWRREFDANSHRCT